MRKRPEPIDVSRSRSKSPSPMFRSRSIPSDILRPTLTPRKSDKRANPLHGSSVKMVLTASGELVEPKTPPGPPPYLKPKRPVIKNRFNKQI